MSNIREVLAKFGTRCAMERPVGRRWVMEIDEAELAINKIVLEARKDELRQLTEFSCEPVGIVHGRHKRSFDDRMEWLESFPQNLDTTQSNKEGV
jgi:hypothetical protein